MENKFKLKLKSIEQSCNEFIEDFITNIIIMHKLKNETEYNNDCVTNCIIYYTLAINKKSPYNNDLIKEKVCKTKNIDINNININDNYFLIQYENIIFINMKYIPLFNETIDMFKMPYGKIFADNVKLLMKVINNSSFNAEMTFKLYILNMNINEANMVLNYIYNNINNKGKYNLKDMDTYICYK